MTEDCTGATNVYDVHLVKMNSILGLFFRGLSFVIRLPAPLYSAGDATTLVLVIASTSRPEVHQASLTF